jgi:hypothetical protein
MRNLPIAIALAALTLSAHAQISVAGHQIGFGVKRKQTGSPTITLVNQTPYLAGTQVSVQFQFKDFDDSKGLKVYSQSPCTISSNGAQKVSDGIYKVDITLDSRETDGECPVTLSSIANQQHYATVRVPYKNNNADVAKANGELHAFLGHSTWVGTTSTGSTYTLHPDSSMPPAALKQMAATNGVMLRDPKLPIPMMLVLSAPNKVSFTRLGCMMDGTFKGTTATLKPSAMVPASSCPDGAVTLEAK